MIKTEHRVEIVLDKVTMEEGRSFSREGADKFLEALTLTFQKACMAQLKNDLIPVNIKFEGTYTFDCHPLKQS